MEVVWKFTGWWVGWWSYWLLCYSQLELRLSWAVTTFVYIVNRRKMSFKKRCHLTIWWLKEKHWKYFGTPCSIYNFPLLSHFSKVSPKVSILLLTSLFSCFFPFSVVCPDLLLLKLCLLWIPWPAVTARLFPRWPLTDPPLLPWQGLLTPSIIILGSEKSCHYHICQPSENRQEYIEILVLYFKAQISYTWQCLLQVTGVSVCFSLTSELN